MKPTVSVIIPAYNSERYLSQALTSVLNQTYRNIEVIVVDDASNDDTVKIAYSFTDNRLKVLENQENLGVSGARNRALKIARGEWIALLDSDDWYAPQRIERLLSVAQQHNADLIADDLFLVRGRESVPWSTLLRENGALPATVELIDAVKFIESDRLPPITAPRNWSFGYTKPLIRKAFLDQHQLNYDEEIEVGEDFALYFRCLLHQAKYILVPEAYYFYRNREASLSTRTPTEYLAQSCQLTQYFIDTEASVRANHKLLMAMSENLIVFEKRLAYERIIRSIKRKDWLNTTKEILINSYVGGDLVAKLLALMWRKIITNLLPNKECKYNFEEFGI